MVLPIHTTVSAAAVRSILHRHRLGARSFSPRPWAGGYSCVYRLGNDLVLKVPHDGGATLIESARVEAVAAGAAHAAGVRTPRLVAFDDSLELLPMPYLVYEWVDGEPLGGLDGEPALVRRVWRDVGRDLALAHTRVQASDSLQRLPTIEQSPEVDPRPWVAELHGAGDLTDAEARWLGEVLDRLAPAALAPRRTRFCHGDVNAANVVVGHDEPRGYVALLD